MKTLRPRGNRPRRANSSYVLKNKREYVYSAAYQKWRDAIDRRDFTLARELSDKHARIYAPQIFTREWAAQLRRHERWRARNARFRSKAA